MWTVYAAVWKMFWLALSLGLKASDFCLIRLTALTWAVVVGLLSRWHLLGAVLSNPAGLIMFLVSTFIVLARLTLWAVGHSAPPRAYGRPIPTAELASPPVHVRMGGRG